LDPAVKAGFGFVVGKSASPSSTPGSAFLWCSFVRPSSRQARRTAPPEINGVNALAFGTLFSSQGASADPKEGTPRNGVARRTMVGTYAWGVNRRPPRGPERHPPGTTIAGGRPGEGPLPSIGTPEDPQLPDLAGPSCRCRFEQRGGPATRALSPRRSTGAAPTSDVRRRLRRRGRHLDGVRGSSTRARSGGERLVPPIGGSAERRPAPSPLLRPA